MKTKANPPDETQEESTPVHRMRLPVFVRDEDIGLGDVLKRTTTYLGLTPCGACERRAASLNNWLAFSKRSGK